MGDAAQVGPDAQSQDLKNAFEQAVDAMAEHLQYTAINADGARQNPLAARGQALVPRYQDALKQIDATDPAKAKPAIDSLLADAESLGKDVATFRAEIEKAVNEWQSRSGAYDGAVKQVEELSEWQHPKEAAVRTLADAIRGMVNDHAYDKAVSTHDQFLPKLQPVYEDLQKQKAAQQQYEPTIATLQPRLAQVAAPSFAKLAGQQSEIASSQTGMEASAQGKDFVAAVAASTALSGRVDTYTTELQKIQQAKDQYEQAHGPLEAKLQTAAAIPNTFKKLASMQADLTSGKQAMESLAQDEEFEQALASTTDLGTKVDTYTTELQKIQQAKDQYEQMSVPLKTKLEAALTISPAPQLVAQHEQLASARLAVQTTALSEAFAEATQMAQDLETAIDIYVKAASEIQLAGDRKLEILDRGDDSSSQKRDPLNAGAPLIGIPTEGLIDAPELSSDTPADGEHVIPPTANADPATNSDFVDKRIDAAGVGLSGKDFILFIDGKDEPIDLPFSFIDFGGTKLVPVDNKIYPNRDQAMASVAASGPGKFAYYRAAHALVVPTTFSSATAPETMNLLSAAQSKLKAFAKEVTDTLVISVLTLAASAMIKIGISRWIVKRQGLQLKKLEAAKADAMPAAKPTQGGASKPPPVATAVPEGDSSGGEPKQLPQATSRKKPTFDLNLTPNDDSGMGHLDYRHAPWSKAEGTSKFNQDAWNNLKGMVNEAAEKGTIGAVKPDASGKPQAGVVYEFKFGKPIGISAKGKSLSRIRVVVDANNHVTTTFPF